jgi:hypothetical protein
MRACMTRWTVHSPKQTKLMIILCIGKALASVMMLIPGPAQSRCPNLLVLRRLRRRLVAQASGGFSCTGKPSLVRAAL